MRRSLLLVALFAAIAPAQRQHPFAPPNAKIQIAPVSGYDLQHVKVQLDVNYPARSISGVVTHTLKPLSAGLKEIKLNAATSLEFDSVTVDGQKAEFRRDDQLITVSTNELPAGKPVTLEIRYHSTSTKAAVSFGGGGWHWIEPNGIDPKHVGFWTQGETLYNREWVPIWDYPNDFTTTESIVTVPAGWSVIGNGELVSNRNESDKATWHWRMDQPHATYLLSLAAGPLDIKKEGKNWFVTPGGRGHLIPASYGDTDDMMAFFTKVTGVPYPWAKYAQNAMIDFGGGMENISSTHLGADSLTDGKDGFRTMSSLNAHELAHQWFGDVVTCKDWGHLWLNESFATYMQWAYFEHARGINEYQREINTGVGEYLGESRQYRRPLATNMYAEPDSMFDSHSYPKGGAVLHTLRRLIGDAKFNKGLNKYLTDNRHKPVDSEDLRKAMASAAGTDLKDFWDQWIYKPGHPVLAYDWNWADGKLTVNVNQKQDTSTGTPIYKIPAKVATITGGKVVRHAITINAIKNTATIAIPKPDAVLLDPDLDFLREMDHKFQISELAAIAEFAPSVIDRTRALDDLLRQEPPNLALITRLLSADMGQFPVYSSVGTLTQKALNVDLDFWQKQLAHPNYYRRLEATNGFAAHRDNPKVAPILASLVTESQPTQVVCTAISNLDAKVHRDLILKAASFESLNSEIKNIAFISLAKAGDQAVIPLILKAGESEKELDVFAALSGIMYIEPSEGTRKVFRRIFDSAHSQLKRSALSALKEKPDPELKPELQKISEDLKLPRDLRESAKKLLSL